MLASLLILADAAEEGRKVVLAMLVVGLIFVAVIALGELTHYLAAKRKARTPSARSEDCGRRAYRSPQSVILLPRFAWILKPGTYGSP